MASVTSFLCEGMPDVIVCIDWFDITEALEGPGEFIFEWSDEPNADAIQTATEAMRHRLAGRKCAATIFIISGCRHRRLKDLRAALSSCHEMVEEGGVVLGGDRIAPFGGGAGCCMLVVVN